MDDWFDEFDMLSVTPDTSAAIGYDIGAPSAYFLPSGGADNSFDLGKVLSGMGRSALNFAQTPQGLLSILAALAAAADRRRGTKPSGGGVSYGMSAPRQLTATQDRKSVV
jgi:hypothetical protein